VGTGGGGQIGAMRMAAEARRKKVKPRGGGEGKPGPRARLSNDRGIKGDVGSEDANVVPPGPDLLRPRD
jgi:hypothetical protein